jgi:hypothetical protein
MVDRTEMRAGVLVFLVLLPGTAAQAELILSAGRMSLELRPDYNWMPGLAFYDGAPTQNGVVTNGPVIHLPEVGYVGGTHGREALEWSALAVDDQFVPAVDGAVYQGERLEFSRVLSLDSAYEATHELSLSAWGLRERFAFHGLDSERSLDIFYAAMSSRVNSFTHWMTFDAAGLPLAAGLSDDDDGSFQRFPAGTLAVAQFDPSDGLGVVTRWTVDAGLGPASFLWDRGGFPIADNKLYLRLNGAAGPAAGEFEVFQSTLHFEAGLDDWQLVATALAAPCPGDVNGDRQVDLSDFGLLKANFGTSGLNAPGDLNRNGSVELGDFGVLKQQFGRTQWPALGTPEAVPEPATWLLALAAAGAVAAVGRRIGRSALDGSRTGGGSG